MDGEEEERVVYFTVWRQNEGGCVDNVAADVKEEGEDV